MQWALPVGVGGTTLARQFRRHQWGWRGGAADIHSTESAPAPPTAAAADVVGGLSAGLSGRHRGSTGRESDSSLISLGGLG